MMPGADQTAVRTVELSLHEACRTAIAALDRAREAPPMRLSQEMDLAERSVVLARDWLIERLRADGGRRSASTCARL